MIPPDFFSKYKPLKFGEILCTTTGSVLIASSMGLAEIDGLQFELNTPSGFVTDNKGRRLFTGKKTNIFKDLYESFTGIKLICEGPDKIMYLVSDNNNFGCIDYELGNTIMFPPFNFSLAGGPTNNVTKSWLDNDGDLFIATNADTIYTITNATQLFRNKRGKKNIPSYKIGIDRDSNMIVTEGAKFINKIFLGRGIIPYSFFEDPGDNRLILIGTNDGLFGYDKQTGQSFNYFSKKTITDIETTRSGSVVWFSTLEKGMGRFNMLTKSIVFFEYPKENLSADAKYPIQNFSRKSANEFFVAISDSFPATFNTETGEYTFITDPLFSKTENRTSDIKMDAAGNLYLTKGGGLYWCKDYLQKNSTAENISSSFGGPYIVDIMLDGIRYDFKKGFDGRDELLKEIKLKYDENNIQIYYSCRGTSLDSLTFAWKLDNYSDEWVMAPYSILDNEMNIVYFEDLSPGEYIFRLKARKGNKEWLSKEAVLTIIIAPPFWQTWLFWLCVVSGLGILIFLIANWRSKVVRRQEQQKAKIEKELLELEAKALRAQMNPHFIFNCLNSIKSLIQEDQKDKSVEYLTTFSKLIRTLFNNADKKEITLYDEIETCKLYLQLEAMRFDNRFSYAVTIDPTIDLKSFYVPALIIQPFIENAIWHGIVPKETGGTVMLNVKKEKGNVKIVVDDNGIGREASQQNKSLTGITHQSKGVNLTQSRLELDNLIQQRKAKLEIIDKKDEKGIPKGTAVVITLAEET